MNTTSNKSRRWLGSGGRTTITAALPRALLLLIICVSLVYLGPQRILFERVENVSEHAQSRLSAELHRQKSAGLFPPAEGTSSGPGSSSASMIEEPAVPIRTGAPRRSGPPSWCARLIREPIPAFARGACGRSRMGAVCRNGKPRFFSQYNQDVFTYQNHWKHLKRPGVFLDIAANEPVALSNTYFFETCLGWSGLCVEANPMYHSLLGRARTCKLVTTCVSDTAETVQFYLEGGRGGITSTNKNLQDKKFMSHRNVFRRKVKLTCVRTAAAIKAAKMPVIDMLSLDVEGHEYKVLKGIDWSAVRINMIVVEAVQGRTAELLREQGYRRYVRSKDAIPPLISSDTIYLHRDVVWGKPE